MRNLEKDIENYQVELDMRETSLVWAITNQHSKYAGLLKKEIRSIKASIGRLLKEVSK